MAGAIILPKLGLTMTEGTITEWCVAPGDAVKPGDVLFVVETDKIANEIEAVEAGTIGAILVEAGAVVPVGTTVATMGGAEVPALATPPFALVSAPPAAGARRPVTPLARRMARNAGIDTATLSGSGPRGRISARDVSAALAAAPPPLAGTSDRPATDHERTIARRLTAAKQDIPHFYIAAEADVTELLALRARLNAGSVSTKLSMTHFLLAALGRALAEMPGFNRVWADGHIRELAETDIGLAVETPRGLVAPVLRGVGGLHLDEIAARMDALVRRARAGRLARGDLDGGAIALSNVGMFGASLLFPIVNPGQSSIIGVGQASPVFRPDAAGQPVLRQQLQLGLSCDHRVIDGATAARFIGEVRRRLEQPLALLRAG